MLLSKTVFTSQGPLSLCVMCQGGFTCFRLSCKILIAYRAKTWICRPPLSNASRFGLRYRRLRYGKDLTGFEISSLPYERVKKTFVKLRSANSK